MSSPKWWPTSPRSPLGRGPLRPATGSASFISAKRRWSPQSPPTIARRHLPPARSWSTPSRSDCRCGNAKSSPTEPTSGWARPKFGRRCLSSGERRQHVDRVARLQQLSLVPNRHTVAKKRAPDQHAGEFLAAAPQTVDKLGNRGAGTYGQLLGIGPCRGAGGREIPHGDPDRAGWTKFGSLMP